MDNPKYVVVISNVCSACVSIITDSPDISEDVCTYNGVYDYHAYSIKEHGEVVTLFGPQSQVLGQIHNVVDVINNS